MGYIEEKEKQDKLGDFLEYFYATECNKCCGVFPYVMHEDNLDNLVYIKCMVCGKESKHAKMYWVARKYWQEKKYNIQPVIDGQINIFDLGIDNI